MNIAILTQNDRIFSPYFIKPFIEVFTSQSKYKLISIFISHSSAIGKKENLFLRIKRILNSFGLFFLLNIFYHFIKNIFLNNSIETLCHKSGINYYSLKNGVNNDHFRKKINFEKIDLIVIVAGSEIIKLKTLNTPKFGFINCHSSILPSNKGLMPVFWSIINENMGFTWYKLNEGIDSGKIILQSKIKQKSCFVDQLIYTKKKASEYMIKAIEILVNEGVPEKYYGFKPCYNKFPTKKEVDKLRKKIKLF